MEVLKYKALLFLPCFLNSPVNAIQEKKFLKSYLLACFYLSSFALFKTSLKCKYQHLTCIWNHRGHTIHILRDAATLKKNNTARLGNWEERAVSPAMEWSRPQGQQRFGGRCALSGKAPIFLYNPRYVTSCYLFNRPESLNKHVFSRPGQESYMESPCKDIRPSRAF